MSPHEWEVTFGSIPIFAAFVLSVWAFCRFAIEERDR